MKKPIRVYRKDWGCSPEAVQAFIDKYYPGQNYVEITEENIWLWIIDGGDTTVLGIVGDFCPTFIQSRVLFEDGGWINQSVFHGLGCKKETPEVRADAAVFCLQAQGVF